MARNSKKSGWKEMRRLRERMRNGDLPFTPYQEAGNWSDEVWEPDEFENSIDHDFDEEDAAEFGHLWEEPPSKDVG